MAWRKVWKQRKKGRRRTGWLLRWYDDAGKMRAKTVYGSASEADDECRSLEQGLNQGSLGKRRDISWLDFCEEFLKELGSCRRPRTVDDYRKVLGNFTKCCCPQALKDVTTAVLRDFVRQATDGRSPATRNKLIRTLRAILATAVPDYLPDNPAVPVKFVDEPDHDMRTVAPDELDGLLAVADDRGRAVIMFGVCCGMRREEIAVLRWQDVNLDSRSVRIRNSEWHITKSGRQRQVLIPPALASLLKTMKANSKSIFIFPNVAVSYRELPNNLRRNWSLCYKTARKQGHSREEARKMAWQSVEQGQRWDCPVNLERLTDLVPRLAKRARLLPCTLHDLRRTFCTYLAACGTDLLAAQKLAGHSSPMVTSKHYVTIVPETLKAQERLPYWNMSTDDDQVPRKDAS